MERREAERDREEGYMNQLSVGERSLPVAMLLAVLAGLLALGGFQVVDGEASATTKQGTFLGQIIKSRKGRPFFAFNGIRYAQAPRRFEEAKPPVPSKAIFNVTKDGMDCLQINMMYNTHKLNPFVHHFVGEEDCLFLNVYTPDLKPETPLPVMVYIHGGAFYLGSGGKPMTGPENLMDKDIVLVAMNYRLGPFGFLSTGDYVVPGNVGLKDQVMALHWVKDNIAHFGGNPNSVTLFGEDAGAACVHLHMMSPRSRGLFHRAISQSGTAHCPWAMVTPKEAREHMLRLSSRLNCTDPSVVRKCLQKKTSLEIMKAFKAMRISAKIFHFEFRPVQEKKHTRAFLTAESMAQGSTTPWISGINAGEGIVVAEWGLPLIAENEELNFNSWVDKYKLYFPYSHFLYGTQGATLHASEKIRQFYLHEMGFSMRNKRAIIQMFSDSLFVHGHHRSKQLHNGAIYQYYFSHHSNSTFFGNRNTFEDLKIPNHGHELFRLFNVIGTSEGPSQEDEIVTDLIVDLWTQFATCGHPTPEGHAYDWETADVAEGFFEINAVNPRMREIPFLKMAHFWEDIRCILEQSFNGDS